MGRIEKIVVLGVLFVVVLILVVSFDAGRGKETHAATGETGETGDRTLEAPPASRNLERPGESRGPGPLDPSAEAAGDGARPVESTLGADEPLDPAGSAGSNEDHLAPGTGATPEAEGSDGALLVAVQRRTPVYAVPDAIPEDWALQTLAGLGDHLFDPTHKVYTARDGDTFESLAERYYGDGAYAALIERANEGQASLEAGQKLLLPTHGDGLTAEDATGPLPEGARTYEVLENESLWVVAKKMYGKGHLWPRIWEANRDRLESPDFVPEGVTLVVP